MEGSSSFSVCFCYCYHQYWPKKGEPRHSSRWKM